VLRHFFDGYKVMRTILSGGDAIASQLSLRLTAFLCCRIQAAAYEERRSAGGTAQVFIATQRSIL
jgi:hypothetical protein